MHQSPSSDNELNQVTLDYINMKCQYNANVRSGIRSVETRIVVVTADCPMSINISFFFGRTLQVRVLKFDLVTQRYTCHPGLIRQYLLHSLRILKYKECTKNTSTTFEET